MSYKNCEIRLLESNVNFIDKEAKDLRGDFRLMMQRFRDKIL